MTVSNFEPDVFIIVQAFKDPATGKTFYRVGTAAKDGVPLFGPPLEKQFEKGPDFKRFLLTKAINAERAAYYAPAFAQKIARTRRALITEVVQKFIKGSGKSEKI